MQPDNKKILNKTDNRGVSTIEIILVLGLVSFIVISIGKIFTAIDKIDSVGEKQSKAYILAQEPIEIVNDLKNNLFACVCSSDSCTSTDCTRLSDGQTCPLSPGYTSCWTAYPANLLNETNFYLEPIGSTWQLKKMIGPREIINADFSRLIIIESIERDASGNIVSGGGTPDPGSKKIDVTVWFKEREEERDIELQSLLTAWENL